MAGLKTMESSIAIDLGHIRKELAEQELVPGAYCQDYETFKVIYRFVERRMRRSEGNAWIILLTLADSRGELLPLVDRDEQMGLLSVLIQSSVRSGDVYTRYSSCQFLLMVLDLSEVDAELIANRITGAYYRNAGNLAGVEFVLMHHCFSMRAAGTTAGSGPGQAI